MKEIPLTKGLVTIIDDEDFERVNKYKWHLLLRNTRRTSYATRSSEVGGTKKTVYLHRFILNASNGLQVDHINGNGLDNRKSNLRLVTHSENLRNSYKHRSGLPLGVFRANKKVTPNTVKYYAQIGPATSKRYLGVYDTIEEASRAVQNAILKREQVII